MAMFTGTEGDTLSVEPPLQKSLCNCTQIIWSPRTGWKWQSSQLPPSLHSRLGQTIYTWKIAHTGCTIYTSVTTDTTVLTDTLSTVKWPMNTDDVHSYAEVSVHVPAYYKIISGFAPSPPFQNDWHLYKIIGYNVTVRCKIWCSLILIYWICEKKCFFIHNLILWLLAGLFVKATLAVTWIKSTNSPRLNLVVVGGGGSEDKTKPKDDKMRDAMRRQ